MRCAMRSLTLHRGILLHGYQGDGPGCAIDSILSYLTLQAFQKPQIRPEDELTRRIRYPAISLQRRK
jgi:hypothetical protein